MKLFLIAGLFLLGCGTTIPIEWKENPSADPCKMYIMVLEGGWISRCVDGLSDTVKIKVGERTCEIRDTSGKGVRYLKCCDDVTNRYYEYNVNYIKFMDYSR